MRISRLTVWHKDLPLKKPYWLSGGRLKFEALDATFLKMDTDEGVAGWAEATPWGHTYLPAHGRGVRAALAVLAPAVIGADPRAFDALNSRMDVALPGHFYAKSPIDIACWDIASRAAGVPLWKQLGADCAAPVDINSSISTGAPDDMIQLIQEASAAGYRVLSAKIGGTDAALDIARIEAIESALPAREQVTFDVNRAWTPALAIQVLGSVGSRSWVEQPCETLAECAHVAARVPQPIMLDECVLSFNDHLDAWRTRACEGVKVKPNRVGGLTKAKQIRDFGVSVGWRMHIEDVGGTVIADSAALHLAAATPDQNRLASWLAHAHLVDDPAPGQGARNVKGVVQLSEDPGLGVTPNADWLGDPSAVYD